MAVNVNWIGEEPDRLERLELQPRITTCPVVLRPWATSVRKFSELAWPIHSASSGPSTAPARKPARIQRARRFGATERGGGGK